MKNNQIESNHVSQNPRSGVDLNIYYFHYVLEVADMKVLKIISEATKVCVRV